jgi:hypothetical protein
MIFKDYVVQAATTAVQAVTNAGMTRAHLYHGLTVHASKYWKRRKAELD